MNNHDLAHLLYKLQEVANDGRGITCVRTVISFLKRDDAESAERVAIDEWDKISNYPKIAEILKEYLIKDEKFRRLL